MADVKPFFVLYCIALADVIAKLTVADLIAETYGRCYCHNSVVDVATLVILYCNNIALAGVIAKLTVADLIAKTLWQMLLPY